MKPCPFCQKPIPEKATFCVGCGRSLTAAERPAVPPLDFAIRLQAAGTTSSETTGTEAAGTTSSEAAGTTSSETASTANSDTAGATSFETAGTASSDTAGATSSDTAGATSVETAGATSSETASTASSDTVGADNSDNSDANRVDAAGGDGCVWRVCSQPALPPVADRRTESGGRRFSFARCSVFVGHVSRANAWSEFERGERPGRAANFTASSAARSGVQLPAAPQTPAAVAESQTPEGRRPRRLLRVAAAALLLVGAALGGAYYAATVWPYAELGPDARDPEIHVSREARDADRWTISCQPLDAGKVVFSRRNPARGTELLEEVSGDAQERLQWISPTVAAGDVVVVTYRQGWRLICRPLALTDASPDSRPVPPQGKQQPSGDVAASNQPQSAPQSEEPSGPQNLYSQRTRSHRDQWLVRYGGSPQTEVAVRNGLEWLARHQAVDGHWGTDCLGTGGTSCCRKPTGCTTSGAAFSVAHSSLAILALQANGEYSFHASPHADAVRRGLDWLIAQQGPEGGTYSREVGDQHHDHMYEHGIAAVALCEACAVAVAAGQSVDPRYRAAAEKAVRFIESQQHRDGGWRYRGEPEDSSDTSVSGWQVLALKNAKEAGIDVRPTCLEHAVHFFRSCRWLDTGKSRYYVFAAEPTPAASGAGMLVQALCLEQPASAWGQSGADYLADVAESEWSSEEPDQQTRLYAWHYGALAMFQHGGTAWRRWNDVIQERIRTAQAQDSQACTFGSWDWQADDFGKQGGRIYTTSLAILTLEVYYRYRSERAGVYGEGASATAQAAK